MDWMIGVLRFGFWWGLGIFLYTTASKMALGPTQPLVQWVPGALSLGVKRPGREADHLPPSSAEVKECMELYLHSCSTPSWHGAQLKHIRDINIYVVFSAIMFRLIFLLLFNKSSAFSLFYLCFD